ncbi:MAG: FAD-dependent oxidoreductase [Coriobacteriales bacterium]|jgi:fumarate reductase flavoprotein subunit
MDSRTSGNADLSRRAFVAGAGAVAGAVAGASALAGARDALAAGASAKADATASGASTATTVGNATATAEEIKATASPADDVAWSWLTYPGDIEPDSEVDTDVLVIGCGFAGSVAAVSAAEEGAKVVVLEKASAPSGRGAHITAFGSKVIQKTLEDGYITEDQMDYAQIVRNWIRWSQGRLNESILWMFAHKSGACMDWLVDQMEKQGLHATLWAGFYKGPDYTEWPVTHFFYDDTTDFVYLNGVSHGLGMDVLLPALKSYGESLGVTYVFDSPCERLLRDGDGPCTGCIATPDGGETHVQYNASKGVILAAGDYSGDTEMMQRYNPWALNAMDERLYIPQWVNTGDLHKQALWIGAAMQKNDSHASVMHLESGAQSYNFLHVNGEGKRFMNEDVNTQSKSSNKAFYGDHRAFTIYDANGLSEIAKQCEDGIAGGISVDQQYRRFGTPFDMNVEDQLLQAKIDDGNIQVADTLEELAGKIDVPVDAFLATVKRYNELVDKGSDDDFGKRSEIMVKIEEPPFYAGQLKATLLTASGGLHSDEYGHVLDADSEWIENLYACGTIAGDFHGSGDYPTICPGINHGRCLTFGRMCGIQAAGGSIDEIADYDIKMPEDGGIGHSTL